MRKSESKLVSIIIPIWNVEKYLPQCIESVLNQTYRNIEVILVDDGSPDKCPQIVDFFEKKDPRVRAIHKENGGYGSAINAGLDVAIGRYISIVESDDYISPVMLELLMSKTEDIEYDIIKGSYTKVFDNGRQETQKFRNLLDNQYEGELNPTCFQGFMGFPSSIWSAVYRKDFLDKNKIRMQDTKGASYQDTGWKFLTYLTCDTFYFIDHPVYYYREMALGSSSSNKKNMDAVFTNYSYLKKELEDRNIFDKNQSHFYYHLVIDLYYHFNRILPALRKEFLSRSCAAIQDIKDLDFLNFSSEIHLENWIRDVIYPFYIMLKKKSNSSIEVTKNKSYSVVKNTENKGFKALAKKIFKMPPFRWFWYLYRKLINISLIKKVNLKAMGIDYNVDFSVATDQSVSEDIITFKPTDEGYWLPRIDIPLKKTGKHALIISPLMGPSGYTSLLETAYDDLHEEGFITHTIVYRGNVSTRMLEDKSDYIYYLEDNSYRFDILHKDIMDLCRIDAMNVDDWCFDDLLQLVASLQFAYNFNICLVNYIFFSRVFTILPATVIKILHTHDKYTELNSRKIEGGLERSLWFSTTEKEEKKALLRADLVLAVQKDEADFFNRLTNDNRAIFSPYVPEMNYIDFSPSKGKLKIGFIGSAFINNLKAFVDFYNLWSQNEQLMKDSEFIIAGSVDKMIIEELGNQECFTFLGRVEKLKDFFNNIDIVINPDMFISGLKIKSVDSLSYGVPILSTLAGTYSIDSSHSYHHMNSLNGLIAELLKIIENRDVLNDYASHSREVFKDFSKKYNQIMIKTARERFFL